MDYKGTPNDDLIDQRALGLPDDTVIDAGAGDDTVIFYGAMVVGDPGNDRYIARGNGALVFWNSPSGVRVDLAKGTASDGFGGNDVLEGVVNVHGTGFDDVIIGSAANNNFFGNGGSDTIDGGAGIDTVNYHNVRSTQVVVSYDQASDTFTIVKPRAGGGQDVDRLTGIERIAFVGSQSDGVTLSREQFAPVNGFLRSPVQVHAPLPSNAFLSQIKAGDFNGDGNADWMIAGAVGSGTAPAPFYFFLGDGKGNFRDGTGDLIPGGALSIDGSGRILVADFNNDKRSDFFQFNFGDDAPPFNGGYNHLFLSGADGKLHDASGTLPQLPQLSHAGSAGDVNGDGFLDLLVNTLGDGANQLYINDGKGGFTPRADLLPAIARGPNTHTTSAILDVDDDSALDLVLGSWDNNPAASWVLPGDGHGDFTRSAPVALPKRGIPGETVLDIKPIDLNGDSLPDLVLSLTNGGPDAYHLAGLQLLLNQGGGRFTDVTTARLAPDVGAHNYPSSGQQAWIMGLDVTDLNLDGRDDIFVVSATDPVDSFVLLSQPDGSFVRTWTSDKPSRSITLDANNDGMDDIVTYYMDGRPVAIDINVMGRQLGGSAADERFTATAGSDTIDGKAGFDVVRIGGKHAAYTIARTAGGFTVQETGKAFNTDTLLGIERLAFDDLAVAFDVNGAGGQAYRLYQAAFDRSPDARGIGFWIGFMDRGGALGDVAASFVQSDEFRALYGSAPTNRAVVERIYQNVLHREADAGGLAFWSELLDRKAVTVADVLVGFSESPENQAALIGKIENGFVYAP